MTTLNSSWSLWYHQVKGNDWSKDSYIFIHKVNTAEELWGLLDIISINHLKSGMYFLMRENIFPDWTDERNIDGGYWSIKVNDKNMINIWNSWIAYMVSETICNTINNSYSIQGISFSPKMNHSIIKLWNSDSRYSKLGLFNKNINLHGCKYFPFNTK